MEITITGLAEVQKMLAEAPASVVATAYVRAMDAATEVIAEELYNRTPERDEGERNEDRPHLKDSLIKVVELDSRIRGAVGRIGWGKMGAVALWVELGHRMVGHAPGKKEIGTVPPHPFARAAFDHSVDRAIEAFANTLESSLRAGI